MPRRRTDADEYTLSVRISLANGDVSIAVCGDGNDLHGLHELRIGRSDDSRARLPSPGRGGEWMLGRLPRLDRAWG